MEINLYKRDDSKYWWMSYTVKGKLQRTSTKCKLKKDAQEVANIKADDLTRHHGIKSADTITLQHLIEEVRLDYKINGYKSTVTLEFIIKRILSFFPPETLIKDIDEELIGKYIKYRIGTITVRKTAISNATINRELTILKKGITILYRKKLIGHVPYFPSLKESGPREGFISISEYKKIYDELAPHLKNVFQFLYKSGWRKEEVLNLKWQHVNIMEESVYLPGQMSKTSKPRTFYMDEELFNVVGELNIEYLGAIRENKDYPDYVFLNTTKTDKIKSMKRGWGGACKRAKCEGKLIHDCRRSAARNLINAGVTEKVAMQILGHKTSDIFKRYLIINDDDIKQATKKYYEHMSNSGATKEELLDEYEKTLDK